MLRHLLRTKNSYIMKKNILTLLAVCALAIGAKAQTELPLLPASHGMLGNQPAFTAQQQQEFPAMATGWNWWSSYIDLSDDGLEKLETMLGSNASIIKSKTVFVSYAGGIWDGNMTALSNDLMYKINLAQSPEEITKINGSVTSIDRVEITAHHGWTWVGFPSSTPISVQDAMANYTASNGDIIKGKTGFASYSDGVWDGSLTTLNPGMGYKIYNPSNNDIAFHYSQASRNATEEERPNTQWIASHNQFADNMTMLAIVKLMGDELQSDEFEVAAYVGNECRGTISLKQVASNNRYMAFLTIAGAENETLQFRLLNHETGDVYLADNSYKYAVDAIEGNMDNPYVLNFNTMLGCDELAISHLDIFPNPTPSGQMVRMSIPGNRSNLKVQIVNTLGMIVKTFNMNSDEVSFSANMAPGIYTIKVVNSKKQLYIEKLIVQ